MKSSISAHSAFAVALCLASLSALAQSDVQRLADRWAEAYNTHDRAALDVVYTENALVMANGSPTTAGRSNIETLGAHDFEDRNPLTLVNETHALEGVDMTLVHGNYQVVDRVNGDTLGFGRFAHIWRRDRNGGWRLDRDLWLERSESAE